jgi:hypothetical protein
MSEFVRKQVHKKDRHISRISPAYRIIDAVKGRDFIEDEVNLILPVIEDDVQKVIDGPDGKTYSETELPTVFDIPGLDMARARKCVYFYVLRALKKARSEPKLRVVGNKVIVRVSWLSDDERELDAFMDKYLKHHYEKPGAQPPSLDSHPKSDKKTKAYKPEMPDQTDPIPSSQPFTMADLVPKKQGVMTEYVTEPDAPKHQSTLGNAGNLRRLIHQTHRFKE